MELYAKLVTEDFLDGVPEFEYVKEWTLQDNVALQRKMETRSKNTRGHKILMKKLKTGKIAERAFCRVTPFVDNTCGQKHATDLIHLPTGLECEIKFDKVAIYSMTNLTKSFRKKFLEIELMRDKREKTARPGSLFIALCKNTKTLFAKLVAEYEYPTKAAREKNKDKPTSYTWRVYKGMELLKYIFGVIARDEMYIDVHHDHEPYRRMVKLPVKDLAHLEIPISEITDEWLRKWLNE